MTFTHPDNAPEGHRWQMEDGKEAHYVGLDRNGWYVFQVDSDEDAYLDAYHPSNVHLFIIDAPKPKRVIEGWVNVYPADDGSQGYPWIGCLYPTKEEAMSVAPHNGFACIHIRAEEGEGL